MKHTTKDNWKEIKSWAEFERAELEKRTARKASQFEHGQLLELDRLLIRMNKLDGTTQNRIDRRAAEIVAHKLEMMDIPFERTSRNHTDFVYYPSLDNAVFIVSAGKEGGKNGQVFITKADEIFFNARDPERAAYMIKQAYEEEQKGEQNEQK